MFLMQKRKEKEKGGRKEKEKRGKKEKEKKRKELQAKSTWAKLVTERVFFLNVSAGGQRFVKKLNIV